MQEKKIALVTGASKGIGLSIAEKISKNNITVIGTSRNNHGKNIINKKLGSNGYGMILDIKNLNEITYCLNSIKKKFGKIDILINNAAITNDKLLINMNINEWNNVITVNLTSIFHISQKIIKIMTAQKWGRIITIGSIVGSIGNIGQINYSASKAGIIGFNKTLALEIASKGITANVISPGFINTGMTKNVTDKIKKKYLKKIPMGRFGFKEEIASAVLFLISQEAAYITGQTIHINGGMYMN